MEASWQGWYFSEELKLAVQLGYRIEILEGVLFERGKIFESYVKSLYTMRSSFNKTDPRNLICKLLLNSLYGKFGMSPFLSKWSLRDATDVTMQEIKITCEDLIELGNKWLISTESIKNTRVERPLSKEAAVLKMAEWADFDHSDVDSFLKNNKDAMRMFKKLTKGGNHLNISLPIAAAVTAYARMSIYQYKANIVEAGGKLFYSDTDSIFSSIPLPDSLIGPELGLMKLEYVASRAVFLAPKVYAVELAEGFKDLTETGFIIKIKGAKRNHGLSFTEMEALLYKDATHKIKMNKWFRSFTQSTINIKDLVYSLRVTENKRALIYSNNKFVYTKPFVITDDVRNWK